jgi:replicative DNA helicase
MGMETPFVIPHNAEVERSILGVLMLAPERIGDVAERLTAEDFFFPLHRRIYIALLRLESAGRPADVLTLQELLGDDKELENAGGIGFLSSLDVLVHRKAPLQDYCRILRESAVLRRLLALCENTREQISERKPSEALLETVALCFDSIRESSHSIGRGPVHISIVTRELTPLLERAADGKGQMLGNPTGYQDIDRLTAGWQASDYCILAARPSAGKTALAIEFALKQLRKGNSVAIFSLEMSRVSIYQRMVCREAGIDSQRLRCGRLSKNDLERILAAVARVDRMPLWIDDSAGLRASDLRWRLRSLSQRHVIRLAVVDYLQLLRSPGKDRFEVVTNSSIELKAAAKELGQISGGTLLALSQLNRAGATERPRLEHLRESGQLEQDGDVIFLLSDAEATENGQLQPCTKILEIAKQRNGPCEDVRFTFLPAVGGFELSTWSDNRSAE